MKTQQKPRRDANPESLDTEKIKYRANRVQPTTLFALSIEGEPGNIYSVVARLARIQVLKSSSRYLLLLNDGTCNFNAIYNMYIQSDWIHSICEQNYYEFILHCRKNIENEGHEYFIEKINQVKDMNQISYHLLKNMRQRCLNV